MALNIVERTHKLLARIEWISFVMLCVRCYIFGCADLTQRAMGRHDDEACPGSRCYFTCFYTHE
jgi:hypothetical protein